MARLTSAHTTRAGLGLPPQSERRHWIFHDPCGCPFGLTEYRPRVDSPSKAWKDMYDRQRERDAAVDRGVTVELVDHDRYVREVYPLMRSSYQCPHGEAA